MISRAVSASMTVFVILLILGAPVSAQENSEGWKALVEGQAVLILRHSLAPGFGDPDHFQVDDCSTQRNLNEEGRAQARAWKRYLASRGIDWAQVYSSQWCRCLDTATAMNVGEVQTMLSLNSFFGHRDDGPQQTRKTIENVNGLSALPIILVSHQVNITALTGVHPSSNEGVIVALPLSQNPSVLARVSPE